MTRKIFALASASALAAVFVTVGAVGCSDEPGSDPPEKDSGLDTGPDRKAPIDRDADTGEEPDADTCMVKEAIDPLKFTYKKPRFQPGACTTAELTALRGYLADLNGSIDITAWKGKVGTSCAACVFSDGSGDSWPPVVTTNDNKFKLWNTGGCLEAIGATTQCAAAFQRVNDCIVEACATHCTSQAEFDACSASQDVTKGPCKAAVTTLNADCDDKTNSRIATCFPANAFYFDNTTKYLCIEGKDGGN